MAEDVAGSLISALAGEGEHVDDGAFTLDPTKAREKLREFQIAEPLGYVLLLVEAATVAGRGRIAFELGATTIARFAGVRFEDHELRNPISAVFRHAADDDGHSDEAVRVRVMQLLALAANAALAGGAERVEIECADEQGRLRRVTLFPELEREPSFETRDEPAPGVCFRYCGSALEFGLGRAAKERALLVRHCELSTTAISVDGERIDAGFAAAFAGYRKVETTQIVTDELGILGEAARIGSEPAKAFVLARGVLAEIVPLPTCLVGLVAVVDVDLRKDLSQRQLLRDQKFEAVVAAIERADERLPWAELATERRAAPDSDAGKSILALLLLMFAFLVLLVIAILRS